jgi:hypothetical protein
VHVGSCVFPAISDAVQRPRPHPDDATSVQADDRLFHALERWFFKRLYIYRMNDGANTISFWLGNDVSHGSGLSGHVRSQSRNRSAYQCAFRPNQGPMVAYSEHRERPLAVRCQSKVRKMAYFCGSFYLIFASDGIIFSKTSRANQTSQACVCESH